MSAAPQSWVAPSFFHLGHSALGPLRFAEGDYVFYFGLDKPKSLRWARIGASGSLSSREYISEAWDPPTGLDRPTGLTLPSDLDPDEIESLLSSAPEGAAVPPYSLSSFSPSAVGAIEHALGFALDNGRQKIHMEHLLAGLGFKPDGALRHLVGDQYDDLIDSLERKSESHLQKLNRISIPVIPRLSEHVLQAFLAAAELARTTNKGYIQHHILLAGARTVTACDSIQILEVHTGDQPATETTPPFSGVHLTDYLSDNASGEDGLEIQPYVRALAALLINRNVKPPLSVGLFGDWGSGKSFFISKLKSTVVDFAAQAKTDPELPFWPGCAQIEFNAWQYADTDLWASLVVRVLEELSRELSPHRHEPDEATRRELVKGLSSVATRKKQLQQEVHQAREAVSSAKSAAVAVAVERRRSEALLEAAEKLGLVNADQRKKLAAEISASGNLVLATLRRVVRRPAAFTGLAALIAAVSLGATETIQVWVAGASGLAGLALLAWKAMTAYSAVEQSVVAGMPVEPSNADRQKIEELEKEEAAQQAQFEQAEKREKQLEAQLAVSLDPQAGLLELLGRRPAYEKSLGLISQIHRDFSRLGELIEKVKAQSAKRDDPKIERIILYIDDLDRCTPKRVVEVLQAVHLLLAFDLFVVVVAVDPRWLRRALEVHYPELLLTSKNAKEVGELATARDYLEKIFQIPFSLPSLTAEKSSDFLATLLAREPAPTKSEPQPPPVAPAPEPSGEPDHPHTVFVETPPTAPILRRTTQPQPIHEEPKIEARQLELSSEETTFMASMGAFFTTPRAAKRFVNSYRLLRATLEVEDLDAFIGTEQAPGPFRAAVLMLAITVQFPGAAQFFRIRSGPDKTVYQLVRQNGNARPKDADSPTWYNHDELMELSELLELRDVKAAREVAADDCREWLARVSRFTFQG